MGIKPYMLITLFLCYFLNLQSQSLEEARLFVKTLSSPEMKGRGYVDDGHLLAANYIVEKYKEYGVQAFQNTYKQYFPIEVNTFPGRTALTFNKQKLIPGVDYIVDARSCSLKGKFKVTQIEKGALLDVGLLQKALNRAKNGVLLIDETNYNPKNKTEEKQVEEVLNFLKYNNQVLIKAIIIYTNKKLTWGIASNQIGKVILTVNTPFKLNKLRKTSIDIEAEFKALQTQNIIGFIKGTEQPDSFLVVTAHYDHLGMMGQETCIYGANDNASGVGMLLSVLHYYSTHRPKYSMAFIALGAEELGLLGAKYYVDHPLFDLKKIKFLINFDLAGTGDEGIKVVNATVYPEQFQKLLDINDTMNYLPAIKKRGEACNSDHCMFYRAGVPGFFIYTLGGTSAYHDINDSYENLSFTAFIPYFNLMIDFFKSF